MKKPHPARLFQGVLASAAALSCLAGWALVASGCSPGGSDDGGESAQVLVAIGESDEDLRGLGGEGEIFVSRSTDGGSTWSSVAVLNSNAGSDIGDDDGAGLATNGRDVWMAAWESDQDGDIDVYFSVSTDGGATWGSPATINDDAGSDADIDEDVILVADRAGTWIAIWETDEEAGDLDIHFARSTDDGQTWSPAQPLTAPNAAVDENPTLAAAGSGTWVAAWESEEDGNPDIHFARSTDGRVNWSTAAPLNSNAGGAVDDEDRQIATDGNGVWLAAWVIDDLTNTDIGFARSATDGASWGAQQPLHSSMATDNGDDADINNNGLATDGVGNWVAVWESDESDGGDLDVDIIVSRSADGGATWSTPARLNTDGGSDSFRDQDPSLGLDGAGFWVVAWESERVSLDRDLFVSRSSDGGAAWSAPAPLNSNAYSDAGDDGDPILRGVGY